MDYSHQDYVNYIQRMIENICPYEDERLRRLYHAGFLASYLAKQMERDPYYLRVFKRHIDELTK